MKLFLETAREHNQEPGMMRECFGSSKVVDEWNSLNQEIINVGNKRNSKDCMIEIKR